MKLAEFLQSEDAQKLTKAAWGRAFGVTRGYLRMLEDGSRVPSLKTAIAIDKATSGKVSFHDWPIEEAEE